MLIVSRETITSQVYNLCYNMIISEIYFMIFLRNLCNFELRMPSLKAEYYIEVYGVEACGTFSQERTTIASDCIITAGNIKE